MSNDIIETAAAAGNFKTLASALRDADLVNTLKGAGPYTVFAPTDAAFAKLPKAEIESLLKDKEKLKGILLFHVLPGSYPSSAVNKMHDGDKVKTVSGKEFTLGLKNNVVTVNGAVVSKTDIQASNGVIRLAVEHRLRERTERHELHVRPAGPRDGSLHQLARDSLAAERLRYVGVIEDHELPVRSRRERQLGQALPFSLDEEGASMLLLLDLNGNLFWRHDEPS